MSLFQMVILFIFLFGGEHLIPEDEEHRMNGTYVRTLMSHEDSDFVIPGRMYGLDGSKLYLSVWDI